MRLIDSIPLSSWLASIGILLVALFLGLWQWFDKESRAGGLDPGDRDFFARQDLRRYRGVGVLVALALLLPLLSSNGLQQRWIRLYILDFVVVCGLIVLLLTLAFRDGLATRRYARRHIQALANERSELVREVLHRTAASKSHTIAPDDKGKTSEL
jgi:hypothetical protein